MKRFIVWVTITVVLLSAWSWKKHDEMSLDCGGPSVSTVPMVKALDWSYAFGEIHRRMSLPGGAPTFMDVFHLIRGTMGVIKLIGEQISHGWKGEPEGPVATGIRRDVERKKAELLDRCCPATIPPDPPQQGEPPAAPFDPKMASMPTLAGGSGKVLTGPALAADALRKAAPNDAKWLSEIPLGVAIARYESTFDPTASNSVYGGHVGLWQISGPNAAVLKLGDRTDPYVNARYAYAIWKGRKGTWSRDWTTYSTALSHVGAYRQFATPTAGIPGKVAPAEPQPPTAGGVPCPTGPTGTPGGPGGAPNGLRVASWNTYVGNSEANVATGMRHLANLADIIGTQEVSNGTRKRTVQAALGSGWAPVCLNTAHPIWYRTAKFTLTSSDCRKFFDRSDSYEGPSQGDRYVNTAVLRDKTTGETDTAVNTHQLPRIQKGGSLNGSWPQRIGFARKIWRGLVNAVRTHKALGPVVAMGDMNYNGDPGGVYAAAGLTGPTTVNGNRPDRNIDRILHTGGGSAAETVLAKFGSDHAARLVTFPKRTTKPSTADLRVVPGARVQVDGKAVSSVAAAQLRLVEAKTGLNLTVMQGGYGGGNVAASGTSHNYPGVVDVACSGAAGCIQTETAMRQAGFAAWARNVAGRSSVGSGAHVHGVSLVDAGDKDAPQVKWSWPNHGNGLTGSHNDPAPHPPLWPEVASLTQTA